MADAPSEVPDNPGALALESNINDYHATKLLPAVVETGQVVAALLSDPPSGRELEAAMVAERFSEVEQSIGALRKSVRRQIDSGSADDGGFDFPEQIYAIDRLQDAAEELAEHYAMSSGGAVAMGNPARIVAERCARLRAYVLGTG